MEVVVKVVNLVNLVGRGVAKGWSALEKRWGGNILRDQLPNERRHGALSRANTGLDRSLEADKVPGVVAQKMVVTASRAASTRSFSMSGTLYPCNRRHLDATE